MTLKTQMASDMSVFFNTDEFAEEVTYTPSGGAGVTIDAIVTMDAERLEPYIRGEDTATCEISVKRTDVATPQHGDTFTFGGETWVFEPEEGVIYKDDDILTIALERLMS